MILFEFNNTHRLKEVKTSLENKCTKPTLKKSVAEIFDSLKKKSFFCTNYIRLLNLKMYF
ncbi:hypothetical protein GCM10008015_10250 [Flavobacterium palustre]|uniref:Uncharacterized protein n=1 Tax=Flavobacterium palustre TaxID=1476463 RepID=A0ABQ1HEG1_9FLAO|nr:hypothetical protein GCM10008015_10250 [Flavobacterium palustre]